MYDYELIDTSLPDRADSTNQLGTSILVRDGAVGEGRELSLEGPAEEVWLCCGHLHGGMSGRDVRGRD